MYLFIKSIFNLSYIIFKKFSIINIKPLKLRLLKFKDKILLKLNKFILLHFYKIEKILSEKNFNINDFFIYHKLYILNYYLIFKIYKKK